MHKKTKQPLSEKHTERDSLLNVTINNLPIGITLFDPNGLILFTNNVGAYYLGYKSVNDLLAQKNLSAMRERLFETYIIKDEEGKIFTADQSPVILALKHKMPFEYTGNFYNKKTKKESWIIARGNPILDKAGSVTMIVYSLTDISKQKQLERQKEDFLSIASHELKTPVTSIKLYTQFLEKTFLKSGERTAVDQMVRVNKQIDKLSNLIGDLLDVTKIQAGKLQFHKTNFSLNHLISEVVEEVQMTTKQLKIVMKMEKEVSLYADRDKIEQVVSNLLTNAIKYSPKSDMIIIKIIKRKSSAVVSVQDFGVGIPAENVEHIFEQFYRVSSPVRDTFPGLGLGLYISSEIVKREGGKIWVESALGKGSIFFVELPLARKKHSV